MSDPPFEPTHVFAAPVLLMETSFRMHYLPLPDSIAEELKAGGHRRVECRYNGVHFRRGVQNSRDHGPFLALSRDALRQIGAAYGDTVEVELRPDPEPDRVDLGEEFEEVLRQDEAAAERFYAMTPGRQRSLASYITSAKHSATRIKRALEMAEKLRTYTLYGDLPPDR